MKTDWFWYRGGLFTRALRFGSALGERLVVIGSERVGLRETEGGFELAGGFATGRTREAARFEADFAGG